VLSNCPTAPFSSLPFGNAWRHTFVRSETLTSCRELLYGLLVGHLSRFTRHRVGGAAPLRRPLAFTIGSGCSTSRRRPHRHSRLDRPFVPHQVLRHLARALVGWHGRRFSATAVRFDDWLATIGCRREVPRTQKSCARSLNFTHTRRSFWAWRPTSQFHSGQDVTEDQRKVRAADDQRTCSRYVE